MSQLTVGLIANVLQKGENYDPQNEEYTSEQEIKAIISSLEQSRTKVIFINSINKKNPFSVFDELKNYRKEIDLVLNLSSGMPWSPSRKFVIPAVLEHLDIPFIGSSALGHAYAMDKAAQKKLLLSSKHVDWPGYQCFRTIEDKLKERIGFPAIVKPACEGTSVGIAQDCVVRNVVDLYKRVEKIIEAHGSPVIVEEFLDGLEYTAGIVGDMVFPPLVMDLSEMPGHPLVRDVGVKDIDPDYSAPLTEFDNVYQNLVQQTIEVHEVLGLMDCSRIDYRADSKGDIRLIEANSLPGLHPTNSDLPQSAAYAGVPYSEFINMIVHTAIQRYELPSEKTSHIREIYDSTMCNVQFFEDNFEGKGYKILKTQK